MYSVTELAKMFETTRKTVYAKLNTADIQQYIKETKQGKRLLKEGLPQFQLIMANSKVLQEKQETKQYTTHESIDYYTGITQDYISELKREIEELKRDKEHLRIHFNKFQEMIIKKDELLKKRDDMLEDMNSKMLLLQSTQKEEKRSILDKIFKRKYY